MQLSMMLMMLLEATVTLWGWPCRDELGVVIVGAVVVLWYNSELFVNGITGVTGTVRNRSLVQFIWKQARK